jgi:hypothetical protein
MNGGWASNFLSSYQTLAPQPAVQKARHQWTALPRCAQPRNSSELNRFGGYFFLAREPVHAYYFLLVAAQAAAGL